MSDDVLRARAYLSRVVEPGWTPLWGLVLREGPVAAAEAVRRGTAEQKILHATMARAATVDPDADLEAALRHGVRLVVPESDEWPHYALAALERVGHRRLATVAAGHWQRDESGEPIPPLALWVKGDGDLASLGVRSVGIVGSRAATNYGSRVAADLAFGLASAGLPIVSGGAYGIDAAAHQGALAAQGVSVLVSAGGLDRPYPSGNAALFSRVSEAGLLISESPPGAAPQRHRFLTRNRLIAALSTGTVLVEAARRSGAANTAHHCRTLGRPTMAVPGPVTSPMSAGCHELIRRTTDPAYLVTDADAVLEVVGRFGETVPRREGEPTERAEQSTGSPLDQLDPVARRVFDGLPARRAALVEEISRTSGVAVLEVLRSLPVLEVLGLIEAGPEGYRISRAHRAKSRVAP